MNDSKETICFTCGMPTGQAPGEFPRLNTLSSGSPCPTCRDRLLECLPGILPGGVSLVEELEEGEALEFETSEVDAEPSEDLPTSIHWGRLDPDEPA